MIMTRATGLKRLKLTVEFSRRVIPEKSAFVEDVATTMSLCQDLFQLVKAHSFQKLDRNAFDIGAVGGDLNEEAWEWDHPLMMKLRVVSAYLIRDMVCEGVLKYGEPKTRTELEGMMHCSEEEQAMYAS